MATLKSHNTDETLHFNIAGLTYFHDSGGYYLEIDYALSTPEHTLELGTVYTGPDFAEELREFDFTDSAFDYAYNFDWENDTDNANWWIEKVADSKTVNVGFAFLRTFWWGEDIDAESQPEIVEWVQEYVEPIRAAQTHCPGLKLAVGNDESDIGQIVASSDHEETMVELEATITATQTEFRRFLQELLCEISDAEDQERRAGLIR